MNNNLQILNLLLDTANKGGRAIWLSHHASIEELIKLATSINLENQLNLSITIEKFSFNWGENITITCNKQLFQYMAESYSFKNSLVISY